MKKIRIGDILIQEGFITQHQLQYALDVQKVVRQKIGSILTRLGLVSEYELATLLARQLGLRFVDLYRVEPDLTLLKRFNRNTCLHYKLFPIKLLKDKTLIATSELPSREIEQICLRATGYLPKILIAEETKVITSIYNYFYFLENPIETILRREAEVLANDTTMTTSPDNFIQNLLLFAVKQRATDIHIRPMHDGISISMRIDGAMEHCFFFPKELKRIITAIKLQAGMDISEQRLPQDGRWSVILLNKRYEIRASSIVTPYGENLVLRLLSQEQAHLSLEVLGFLPEDMPLIKQAFAEPFGILLLTGPTGSGKSTTLTAGLLSIDLLGKNVLTIEDPIEYVIPLARQTQVNRAAGYDFANAIRYFLRHDPDVILVGEMRDEITAKTAMTAANTGHFVLSTLHTNTALGAIPRLQGLGVDNLTIAESLVCIVSQRLVRTICPQCKEEYAPDEEEKKYLKQKDVTTLYRGKGCSFCNYTGYKGRTLVYEILPVSKKLRSYIEQGENLYKLEQIILESGFKTMFDIAVKKVLLGLTDVKEVKRVLGTRY
ncbi:MAG: GspE/PulE family protein [Desulfonauticus sp.]|nr:GspE/PulE family protein [Desulfonauticus sp.]